MTTTTTDPFTAKAAARLRHPAGTALDGDQLSPKEREVLLHALAARRWKLAARRRELTRLLRGDVGRVGVHRPGARRHRAERIVVARMITVSLLLGLVLAVKFRTFRWVAAILLVIAFVQAHPVLVTVAAVVAVALRAGWHGYRATVTANEARRAREAQLSARADAEDLLVTLGDPRGIYGL
ncbi:hypothetical protein [Mycobacterium sp. 852002-51057_SCH5723018]|uniref:hypothetical protein n=1 Tax=Mycobacterium sp. 852002-51057_SCH5723018 TaxID=1834094 RepID=UPI000801D204|nr:hypothetical protein [Mycobacterium sp. 852002-51057_SCH5723018]OBG20572.1 hypothetical protein A5764_01445 [Mycobacterium sp. 852002-51057_SCH5723018]